MKNPIQKLQEIANQKKIVDAQLQALDRKNKNLNQQKREIENNFLKWVKEKVAANNGGIKFDDSQVFVTKLGKEFKITEVLMHFDDCDSGTLFWKSSIEGQNYHNFNVFSCCKGFAEYFCEKFKD